MFAARCLLLVMVSWAIQIDMSKSCISQPFKDICMIISSILRTWAVPFWWIACNLKSFVKLVGYILGTLSVTRKNHPYITSTGRDFSISTPSTLTNQGSIILKYMLCDRWIRTWLLVRHRLWKRISAITTIKLIWSVYFTKKQFRWNNSN